MPVSIAYEVQEKRTMNLVEKFVNDPAQRDAETLTVPKWILPIAAVPVVANYGGVEVTGIGFTLGMSVQPAADGEAPGFDNLNLDVMSSRQLVGALRQFSAHT